MSELRYSSDSQELSKDEAPRDWNILAGGGEERREENGTGTIYCFSGTTDPMAALRMGSDSMLNTLPPAREQPYCWEHIWLDLDFGKTQQARVM